MPATFAPTRLQAETAGALTAGGFVDYGICISCNKVSDIGGKPQR